MLMGAQFLNALEKHSPMGYDWGKIRDKEWCIMAFEILHPSQGAEIRGVLFDMDGVILDSEKLYARFWAAGCEAFGYHMTYQQALGMRSLSAQMGQEYLSSLFGPEISYAQVRAKRIELMDAYVEENGIEAKPGIFELLEYLAARQIPYAITTASPNDRIQNHLGRLGLYEKFPHICTAHEVAHGKPAPDIYLLGAKTIAVPPERCLALEDSYTGLLSAHRAGCMATIVPDLDQPGENILSIAYARADSLTDVMDLMEGSLQGS